MNSLTFSLLSSSCHLTKRFELLEGTIVKAAAAQMTHGHIRTVRIDGLHGLLDIIQGLTSSHALAYGTLVSGQETAEVVSQAQLEEARRTAVDPNAIIARTREYLNFAHQPGVMMHDHDEYPERLSPEELIMRVTRACPAIEKAAKLWKPSSSYGIHAAHDSSLALTSGGQRLYVAVKSAADIPEAGHNLFLRQWAAGLGWIKVSKSGRPLKRALLDPSVYQPERLDFAGPPILGPGLIRDHVEPRFIEGCEFLDVVALQCDAEIRNRAERAMVSAIEQATPKLQAARARWIEERAPVLVQRQGISLDHARRSLEQASEHLQLSGEFILLTADGDPVSVHEVLSDQAKWHGTRFADPLEPDYGNEDHRIAWANLKSGTRPYLYSHAHGGMRYTLTQATRRILVAVGERGRMTTDTEHALCELGEVFEYGEGGTARISRSRILPVSSDWLADYIDRNVSYYGNAASGTSMEQRPCNAPAYLAKRILARSGDRGFPRLEGLVTVPTLRRDGSILDTPGYDQPSGILYSSDLQHLPRVPIAPTSEEACRALTTLWHPFKNFPFDGAASQTVLLSAIFSGILRPSLPTCPAHAFDAPAAGTGKTLLAECVGILATGERPAIIAPTDDENEIRKRLFAMLREGGGVILWDNISGSLGGDALDSFLTAERYRDRVLGVSQSETLPNRAVLLITGNNISTRGDTFRRVLKARLDAKEETPYLRAFSLNPREYCLAHRHELVVAALTIIRAWVTAGRPQVAQGNTASFEEWDRLVRQPLAWLANQEGLTRESDVPVLCDVAVVFTQAAAEAPHKEKLRAVLQAWASAHGIGQRKRMCAREFCKQLSGGFDQEQDELHMAVADAVGKPGHLLDSTTVGYWLKKHRGERMNDLWFERDGEIGGAAAYVLRADWEDLLS